VEILVTLFGDRETMVLGSAMAAFVEVCPERHDMIHPHFRKFCKLLADLDEWGQIVMLNQLTRYARTQFCKPPLFVSSNVSVKKTSTTLNFYADDDSNEESDEESTSQKQETAQQKISTDHKLLLRSVRPVFGEITRHHFREREKKN
jgi:AP-3 complex subunit beta